MDGNTIKFKLVRSAIGKPKSQKETLQHLGLSKINKIVEKDKTDSVMGMYRKVSHLVEIVEN